MTATETDYHPAQNTNLAHTVTGSSSTSVTDGQPDAFVGACQQTFLT